MKKHTERQPIDDLFARKLGDMSLPPSADGFERLKARMGQKQLEARIVFWRNPIVHRSMAAAACLVVVCLFGWLYWPSGSPAKPGGTLVASSKSAKKQNQKQLPSVSTDQSASTGTDLDRTEPSVIDRRSQTTTPEQVAQNQSTSGITDRNHQIRTEAAPVKAYVEKVRTMESESVVAQTKPASTKTTVDDMSTAPVQPITTVSPEQPVVASAKPMPTAERGLVVTIAEPEALVAARQAAKATVDEKTVLAANDKPEKETKSGNLWQQVKRFKQGEVFARGDNGDSESGLLGRAYSGLKHSIEKDKAAKQ